MTLDGTRIEQALLDLVGKFNDVPPNLVRRRWSQSAMVWGLSPGAGYSPAPYQWLSSDNDSSSFSTFEPPTATQIRNYQRAKSTRLSEPVDLGSPKLDATPTMEVTFATSSPLVIGALTLFAEVQTAGVVVYTNPWEYGALPPPGRVNGESGDDFTLQVCVSDGWDIENRKKLRQEALIYNMVAESMQFNPAGVVPADTIIPAHPCGIYNGFALTMTPPVLVPAGARVVFQMSIPKYDTNTASTWYPPEGAMRNVWSLHAQIWRPTV